MLYPITEDVLHEEVKNVTKMLCYYIVLLLRYLSIFLLHLSICLIVHLAIYPSNYLMPHLPRVPSIHGIHCPTTSIILSLGSRARSSLHCPRARLKQVVAQRCVPTMG